MKVTGIAGALAILTFTAGSVLAAPCNTGSTKGKSPDQTMNEKSSDVDKSSKNLAGGQQPASPGTVGAMNNVGAGQTAAAGQGTSSTGDKTDPGAKNLAGGQQPASPGTVGAMNNSVPNQELGKKGDDC
ncbi:exopolysaccharide production protein YjbE [Methylobacterium hispanicum]|jgi:hypothetical protein|uniref:Exopolysaccharide production protein YjbE n=1 Tax=Methylobacterium hispanicum TaxID=270350 RepID=A0AAV4ZJJ9_9HYPH|nr:exopolysaccharide production protein YjbE [Methylobacterium hispanicum]GJD88001.1 hypothetical protein BHAOGJBA_1509 [Methylobacterium hispanicum]